MRDRLHYDLSADRHNITLSANNNTLDSVLDIAHNYTVDSTAPNSIRTILGFNAKVYLSGTNESENIVNILTVTSLRITSDIIGSSYSNGSAENIIYSFFPNVSPGYKIIEVPVYLETQLVDQTGNLVNLCGEELSIRFDIREV